MFTPRRIRNCSRKDKPWAYPPLPPDHTLPPKKVSFLNFAIGDDMSSNFNEYQNMNSDRVKKIVNKYSANNFDHESSDCDSVRTNENEFKGKLESKYMNAEELEEQQEEDNVDRMRGGCGNNCPCAGEQMMACDSQHVAANQRSIKKFVTMESCSEPATNRETCSISSTQNPNHFETPLVNTSSYCCSKSGSHPVSAKSSRCNSPCRSEDPGCGGGGCCGAGCRGGCGKLGRPCMSLRTCSRSTYRGHSFASRSHWSLSKSDTPRAVSNCRTETASEQGDILLNEQSSAMDDCKPLIRSKSGCECLGGGLDCQRCGRKVYQAEMMIAAGSPYHNICFSCYCCRKPLEPLTYQENCGEIYCKQCLIRNFGPQGYGYGVGAGVLQTPI